MQIASHTNPNSLPLDANGKRGWSNSFFGCFGDCGTCTFPPAAFVLNRDSHLRSQVSPPPAVPALYTPRSIPGSNISQTVDLPIHPVVMPAAAPVSFMLLLPALVFLVSCRFVSLYNHRFQLSENSTTVQTMQRGSTRGRYNISGNGCVDCLAACCCPVCELVQEAREIELEENTYGKQTY